MSDTTYVIRMVLEKETENTLRYKEVTDEPPVLGTLYIKKYAVPSRPKAIVVTIDDSPSQS